MEEVEFRELVRRHDPFVRRVAFSVTRSRHDADEVTAQVWWNVWRAIDRFDNGVALEAWLMTIVVNVARDFLRKQKLLRRVGGVLQDCHCGQEATTASPMVLSAYLRYSPEELAEAAELTGIVDQLIEALPIEFRATIKMRVQEEASYEEIRLALVPSGAMGVVKSRIYRARALMVLRLKELGYNLSE
jgi:RNA polymerase sigma-70 factor (ECF subfamily)